MRYRSRERRLASRRRRGCECASTVGRHRQGCGRARRADFANSRARGAPPPPRRRARKPAQSIQPRAASRDAIAHRRFDRRVTRPMDHPCRQPRDGNTFVSVGAIERDPVLPTALWRMDSRAGHAARVPVHSWSIVAHGERHGGIRCGGAALSQRRAGTPLSRYTIPDALPAARRLSPPGESAVGSVVMHDDDDRLAATTTAAVALDPSGASAQRDQRRVRVTRIRRRKCPTRAVQPPCRGTFGEPADVAAGAVACRERPRADRVDACEGRQLFLRCSW